MSVFKKNQCLMSVVACLIAGSALFATAQASDEAVTSASTTTSAFLVQSADRIVLTPGKVTLIAPEKKVLWFANAPSTGAGFQTLNEYMKQWATPESYFSVNHPNATLIGYFIDSKRHEEKRLTLVMTLEHAHLAGDQQSLTYQVTKTLLIPDNKSYNTKVTLYHPTLLIDDIPAGGVKPY